MIPTRIAAFGALPPAVRRIVAERKHTYRQLIDADTVSLAHAVAGSLALFIIVGDGKIVGH